MTVVSHYISTENPCPLQLFIYFILRNIFQWCNCSRSGEAYSIQHYVIKFVSDLRQVGGFLQILRFPPPIKLTATAEILLKVALNTIILTLTPIILHKFDIFSRRCGSQQLEPSLIYIKIRRKNPEPR